jgi:hypothetical protein
VRWRPTGGRAPRSSSALDARRGWCLRTNSAGVSRRFRT